MPLPRRSGGPPGWQGETLTWDGHDLEGGAEHRLVYQRLDPARFAVRHDLRDGTGWRRVTALTCVH